MSFMPQQNVRSSGIEVINYSAPASVIFNNKLYLFYSGAGDDGVWYVNYDENTWSSPSQCKKSGASKMGVAKHTSPCPVVFNNTFYLFFNGIGDDGTWCTTSTDGLNWSQVFSVMETIGLSETFAPSTSPSAIVHQSQLYLFWNNNSKNGLRYSTFDGRKWDGVRDVSARGLGVWRQTSSAAVEFKGSIFLFYNGSGNDGTWMTKFADGSWSGVVSLSSTMGGMGFLDGTSPAAFVSDDGIKLTLMWNGSGNNGVWYSSTTDGTIWDSPAISMRSTIGTQNLKTSPCGVSYHAIPYVFWVGAGDGSLWLSQGLTINVDYGDFSRAQRALLDGFDFTLIVTDPATLSFFQPRFGPGPIALPSPDGNYSEVIDKIIGSDKVAINKIVTGILALSLLAILMRYDVEVELGPFRWAFRRRPTRP